MPVIALLFLISCQKAPPNLGLKSHQGTIQFAPCSSPCLTSLSDKSNPNFSDPIKGAGGQDLASQNIKSILEKSFGTKPLLEKDNYLRYELPNLFGPNIDLEFLFNQKELIHFRISSRGGFLALKPLKVIEEIRFKYYQRDF